MEADLFRRHHARRITERPYAEEIRDQLESFDHFALVGAKFPEMAALAVDAHVGPGQQETRMRPNSRSHDEHLTHWKSTAL